MGTTWKINMHSFLVICELQLLFNVYSFHLNDLCTLAYTFILLISFKHVYILHDNNSTTSGIVNWDGIMLIWHQYFQLTNYIQPCTSVLRNRLGLVFEKREKKLELLCFWTFSIIWYSKNYKKQRFGDWICFHPQVGGGETATLLGP
jgi:hypothetical protein